MTGRNGRTEANAGALAAITVPTLILQGEQDNLVPASHAEKFNAAIAGSTLKLYANVGHLPQEEAMDQSLGDMRDFLETQVYAPAEPPEGDEAGVN
jgi:pimeloyl-ACP methyl ester carboxylesterase